MACTGFVLTIWFPTSTAACGRDGILTIEVAWLHKKREDDDAFGVGRHGEGLEEEFPGRVGAADVVVVNIGV